MLVFQTDWKHIKEGCTRANVNLGWLVEVVAEINLYLPDDWRMTRSTNNFRIQIVAEEMPALVGFSYRGSGDEIIHIIDSVFPKGYFDKFDLQAIGSKPITRVDKSIKQQHPEIVIPNVYFYRPCPDDSVTPLFARQYVKIKLGRDGNPVGDQYHRIHPLSKAGLDLEHFRWVHWNINGHVEDVETPDAGYHGKDYWEVPLLEKVGTRSSR
ncbi:MAG TPA: hypothetical protein EYP19_12165, partial [Desulfobacterales bacterium]|nr:hypothetical protein [Desulfobacterales bacterium]